MLALGIVACQCTPRQALSFVVPCGSNALAVINTGEQQAFAVGADFGVRDSIEELLELVGEAIKMGAPRIKLKCAKGWVRCQLPAVATR